MFGITTVQFQIENCIINMSSETFCQIPHDILTHLLVFGSPKGSPNISKIRQNVTRYLAEMSDNITILGIQSFTV